MAHSGTRCAKRYEQAIKDYLAAIERKPNSDWAFNNLGLAYLALNQHSAAVDRGALQRQPSLEPQPQLRQSGH